MGAARGQPQPRPRSDSSTRRGPPPRKGATGSLTPAQISVAAHVPVAPSPVAIPAIDGFCSCIHLLLALSNSQFKSHLASILISANIIHCALAGCCEHNLCARGPVPYSSVLISSIVRPQAAASTTFVQGVLSPQRAKAMSARGRSINQEGGQRYSAAALSLVFHPAHPLIPTLRADVRRFEVRRCREHAGCAILALKKALSHCDNAWHLQKMQQPMLCAARPCPPSLHPLQTIRNGFPGQAAAASVSKLLQVEGQAWFGGGADLTPAFLCEEDAREFHAFWHALCGRHQVRSSYSVLAPAPSSSSQMKQQPAMGHCAIVPLWGIFPNFYCV